MDFCAQVRSQDFYKGGHDDGGTEGPERGAKARSGVGVGSAEGRRSSSPVNFPKINVEIAHFPLVLATSACDTSCKAVICLKFRG